MDKLLRNLYDHFYQPLPNTQLKKEIEECHNQLIEVLEKNERRLVLQIIDAKDQIADSLAIDSFISGFLLAHQLQNELNIYKETHPLAHDCESDAFFDS